MGNLTNKKNLSRKPKRVQASEAEIDAIIEKGGSVGHGDKPKIKRGRPKNKVENKKIPVQLRMTAKMIDEIDEIRTSRIGMSRHAWILEAIVEKMTKDKHG